MPLVLLLLYLSIECASGKHTQNILITLSSIWLILHYLFFFTVATIPACLLQRRLPITEEKACRVPWKHCILRSQRNKLGGGGGGGGITFVFSLHTLLTSLLNKQIRVLAGFSRNDRLLERRQRVQKLRFQWPCMVAVYV